jgi:uncharacterized membrane protein
MSTTPMISRQAFPGADDRAGRFPRSRSPVRPESHARGHDHAERLAGFLGWFSIGLGMTSLAAPRGLARFIGARGDRTDCALLRLVGLQELACGLGILSRRRPAGWVWARVAGDLTHLTMLGGAMASGPPRPDRMATATASVVAITALDTYDAIQLGQRPEATDGELGGGAVEVHQAITINRPAEELYRFWRDFRNLPRIMSHLESVHVTGDGRSHWKAKAPAGMTVEWDAEVTEDRPNELLAWRSVGGQVDNAGSVRFVPAPGGRGTEVHVTLRYDPPGGVLGKWVARLFGESPEQHVFDDLRHFKQVMETGEVVLSEGSFDGSHIVQRPAQPPASVAGR